MAPVVTTYSSLTSLDAADASTASGSQLDTPRSSTVRRPAGTRLSPDRRFDTPRGSALRHELPAWR